MTYALAFVSVFVFALLLKAFQVPARGGEIINLCRCTVAFFRDQSHDDQEKETHARIAAGIMFKKFASISFLGLVAIIASTSIPIIASVCGFISLKTFSSEMLSWPVVLFTSITCMIVLLK